MSDEPMGMISGHLRYVVATQKSEPGSVLAQVFVIDKRIPIDPYIPSQPNLLWTCDTCGNRVPVSAELPGPNGSFSTVCAICLQHALNGVLVSLANPQLP